MILRFSRGKVGSRLFKVRSKDLTFFCACMCACQVDFTSIFIYLVTMNSTDIIIRPIQSNELPLLRQFLHEAIFVPEGVAVPHEDVVDLPELSVYIDGFGSSDDDICFVVDVGGVVAGAVWCRIMHDYGHVDDMTPSLAMSLLKAYRNRGIGTMMLQRMISELAVRGYERVSLSVQKANYAVRLYRKVGFEVVGDNGDELLMVCNPKR